MFTPWICFSRPYIWLTLPPQGRGHRAPGQEGVHAADPGGHRRPRQGRRDPAQPRRRHRGPVRADQGHPALPRLLGGQVPLLTSLSPPPRLPLTSSPPPGLPLTTSSPPPRLPLASSCPPPPISPPNTILPRYEVVEILLSRGANKEHRNVSDYTPLSLAASGGYTNIIKLLLAHGAEINSRTGAIQPPHPSSHFLLLTPPQFSSILTPHSSLLNHTQSSLITPPSSLLPHHSLLLPHHSSLLNPNSSSLLTPPHSSLLTPPGVLLTPPSSLLLVTPSPSQAPSWVSPP